MNDTFEFMQCITLLKSAGKKAKSLKELRDLLAAVSARSISHHTHQYFLKGHILEYTNDFSQWAGESLEERALAEQLSNIDPYDFGDIEKLRRELIRTIDSFCEQFPEPREVRPRDEFYFNETVTLLFPAGIQARNLAEFLLAVRYVDASSLYYHFFDARVRLEGGTDDFSKWIEERLGKPELAQTMRAIDPFIHNLEGIRERIAASVEEEVRKDMERTGIVT